MRSIREGDISWNIQWFYQCTHISRMPQIALGGRLDRRTSTLPGPHSSPQSTHTLSPPGMRGGPARRLNFGAAALLGAALMLLTRPATPWAQFEASGPLSGTLEPYEHTVGVE